VPRILSVVGTRPEAIKMAPVVHELERFRERVQSLVCSTGQHREMLEQVFTLFGISPDYDLYLMRPDQGLSALTARMLEALDGVVAETRPDWILAQGDTTTVMVSALVAYYHRVRFGHVEAGLRTGDRYSPFPEEMNRRIADCLATLYFAPTERSRRSLLGEGVRADAIHVTGNTVVDALLSVADMPYDWSAGPLGGLPQDKRLVLVTAHRRESFGETFRGMCLALRELAEAFASDGVHFVYPVHLNPNVRRPVQELLAALPNFSLLEPLDYLSLVQLMKRSELVLTDSGGIQEEAPTFGVPVLVMRDTTERPEGVEAGVARLTGTERRRIVQEAGRVLGDADEHARMRKEVNPYGDGHAAERIVAALLDSCNE
jgi:UDP-N-acetylglucosamine 2-epimerase (non-hydrolysing)